MSAPAQRTHPHVTPPPAIVTIGSLDQEGRGIARIDGKAVFVEGALPGEVVAITTLKRKPTYEIARADSIAKPNAARVQPQCPHFGVCGGCSLQHFDAAAQVAAKQRALEDALWHIGRVRPGQMLPPIHGPAWEYRHRARLSVRHVAKKGGVLIGFHERKSSYVADMTSCAVLPRRISDLLPKLRVLIGGLTVRDRLPQIELAVGDGADAAHVLVLRILEPLATADEAALGAFADAHGVQFYLQPGGPGTVAPLRPSQPTLAYVLPEFGLRFPYSPTEFTQVNPAINRVLVRRALALLDPRPGERIADFFCGIGNFTLPIARRGATVVGIEGSAALVQRAADNAAAKRPGGQGHVPRRRPVRRDAGKPGSTGAAGQDPRRSATRRRNSAGQGAARRWRAAAHRVRIVQPGHTRPRRVGAGPRSRLHARRGRSRQHVPAYGARRIDRRVRALTAREKNRGSSRRPDDRCRCPMSRVSRAAPKMPAAGSAN